MLWPFLLPFTGTQEHALLQGVHLGMKLLGHESVSILKHCQTPSKVFIPCFGFLFIIIIMVYSSHVGKDCTWLSWQGWVGKLVWGQVCLPTLVFLDEIPTMWYIVSGSVSLAGTLRLKHPFVYHPLTCINIAGWSFREEVYCAELVISNSDSLLGLKHLYRSFCDM